MAEYGRDYYISGESNLLSSYHSVILCGTSCTVDGPKNVLINCHMVTVRAVGCVAINCSNIDITDDCSIWINNSKVENGAGVSFLLGEWLHDEINREDSR